MISIQAELMSLESLGSNSHSSSLGIRNNEIKYLIGTQILPVMQTSVGSTAHWAGHQGRRRSRATALWSLITNNLKELQVVEHFYNVHDLIIKMRCTIRPPSDTITAFIIKMHLKLKIFIASQCMMGLSPLVHKMRNLFTYARAPGHWPQWPHPMHVKADSREGFMEILVTALPSLTHASLERSFLLS